MGDFLSRGGAQEARMRPTYTTVAWNGGDLFQDRYSPDSCTALMSRR